jgi:hypothetical protein
VVRALELLYGPYAATVSRADFWALASVVAVEFSAWEACRGPCCADRSCTAAQVDLPVLTYRWGRIDAPNCVAGEYAQTNSLPNARAGLSEINRVFGTGPGGMGLTSQQYTALLGAHTLGRAFPQNSGFRGPWVQRTRDLDNEYYTQLLTSDWIPSCDGPPNDCLHAFECDGPDCGGGGRKFMLNAGTRTLHDTHDTTQHTAHTRTAF